MQLGLRQTIDRAAMRIWAYVQGAASAEVLKRAVHAKLELN
jgi:hypothetical protein